MAIVELFDSKMKINVNSELESWRVSTLLTKEPETIAWISSWEILPSFSFFDVGANTGLFSIFAALQHPDLKVFSFEPEVKNYSASC